MSAPQLYLFLGSSGSGRRAVIADLVANGLESTDRALVLTARDETPLDEATEKKFSAITIVSHAAWALDETGHLDVDIPEAITHIFFVVNGRANPIDQIEALHLWLPSSGVELGRVLTVINCQLAHAHAGLVRWYDALVHFSDVVLLNQRDGVPNKWVSDFVTHFKKRSMPCLLELVKKGAVENPARILVPEARRISMLFDSPDAWPDPDLKAGGEADDDEEDDDDANTPSKQDVADGDLIGGVDPYLERFAGSGRRAKEIPDITKFL